MSVSHSNLTAILEDHAASLLKEGKTEDALRVATTALATARQAAADDKNKAPVLLKALESIAAVQREMQDISGAEAHYREAIELLAETDLLIKQRAAVRAKLATLLDFSQQEAKAVLVYEQAIADYEAMDPPDEDTAAQLRNNLAMIYKGLGKFALSEQHYLRGLEILEQKHGHDSEFTATLFNNLGSLYYTAGFPDQGKEMIQEGLEIRIRLLGLDDPDVAQSYCNLATTCHELGDDAAATQHYEQCLRILEKHIADEAKSYEAVGLDYIALLGSMREDKKAAAFQKRMEKMLQTARST